VQRFSETEPTAPSLSVLEATLSGSTLSFGAAPYALTYIELDEQVPLGGGKGSRLAFKLFPHFA
jgi:hypothetical protein